MEKYETWKNSKWDPPNNPPIFVRDCLVCSWPIVENPASGGEVHFYFSVDEGGNFEASYPEGHIEGKPLPAKLSA